MTELGRRMDKQSPARNRLLGHPSINLVGVVVVGHGGMAGEVGLKPNHAEEGLQTGAQARKVDGVALVRSNKHGFDGNLDLLLHALRHAQHGWYPHALW